MLDVTLLVGNPRPASRTLNVGRTLVESLLAPGGYALRVIDLVAYSGSMFDWPSETMADLGEQVAGSDLLVVASPTYKAAYTGLLKSFLDRYPSAGLQGVVAIPVMTGGDLMHALAPEVSLRPLLVELGASVPTRGLYLVTGEMDRLQEQVDAWEAINAPALAATAALVPALRSAAAAS